MVISRSTSTARTIAKATLFLILAVGLGISAAFAQSDSKPDDSKDLYGDLLPKSVIARLGSLGADEKEKSLRGHQSTIYVVTFSPDGKLLASRDSDQIIRLWDATTGKTLHILRGHEDRVLSIAFSPTGKLLATASREEVICLWNVADGKKIRTFDDGGSCLRFTPDGKTLVCAQRRTVSHFNVESGGLRRQFPIEYEIADLSPDGKTAATIRKVTDKDYRIELFDVEKNLLTAELIGCGGQPISVRFSPDGLNVAAGGRDDLVHVWETAGGRHLFDLKGHENPIQQIDFSPDGRLLVSGSWDGTAKIWEMLTAELIVSLDAHRSQAKEKGLDANVSAVAISPDGLRLATGSRDQTILVWDIASATSPDAPVLTKWTTEIMDQLWGDLASENAKSGTRAISMLAVLPEKEWPQIEKFLKPSLVSSRDDHILKLIGQLTSDSFREREKATKELKKIRRVAEKLLRKTLAETKSSEVRSRIQKILDAPLSPSTLTPVEMRRMVRLLAALEYSSGKSALAMLETISKTHGQASVQNWATEAIARKKRGAP